MKETKTTQKIPSIVCKILYLTSYFDWLYIRSHVYLFFKVIFGMVMDWWREMHNHAMYIKVNFQWKHYSNAATKFINLIYLMLFVVLLVAWQNQKQVNHGHLCSNMPTLPFYQPPNQCHQAQKQVERLNFSCIALSTIFSRIRFSLLQILSLNYLHGSMIFNQVRYDTTLIEKLNYFDKSRPKNVNVCHESCLWQWVSNEKRRPSKKLDVRTFGIKCCRAKL